MLRVLSLAIAIFLASPAQAHVAREGGAWVIDARGASRAELAQQLAVASGSRLQASSAAWLRHAPPLTTRWRAASLAQAWQQLLGDDMPYALRCTPGGGCEVWIVGAAAAAPARRPAAKPGVPAVEHSAFGPDSAAGPAARGLAAAPPQPDPPGLFPAD